MQKPFEFWELNYTVLNSSPVRTAELHLLMMLPLFGDKEMLNVVSTLLPSFSFSSV